MKETMTTRVRVYANGHRFALTDFERSDAGGSVAFEDVVSCDAQYTDMPYREFDLVAEDVELPSGERPSVSVIAPPLESPALGAATAA